MISFKRKSNKQSDKQVSNEVSNFSISQPNDTDSTNPKIKELNEEKSTKKKVSLPSTRSKKQNLPITTKKEDKKKVNKKALDAKGKLKEELISAHWKRSRRKGLELSGYTSTIDMAKVPSFLRRQIKLKKLRLSPLRSRNTRELQTFLCDNNKIICVISLVSACESEEQVKFVLNELLSEIGIKGLLSLMDKESLLGQEDLEKLQSLDSNSDSDLDSKIS